MDQIVICDAFIIWKLFIPTALKTLKRSKVFQCLRNL